MYRKRIGRGMVTIIIYIGLGLLICVYGTSSGDVIKKGDLVKIMNVPLINQYPELPTGCEVTALTMLLQYNGVSIRKTTVADDLPKVSLPYYKNGVKVGPHPNQGFIGTPYSKVSYGVYAEPILKLINKYLPGRVEDLRGKPLEELLRRIDEGRPVMIWGTIGMENISYSQSWVTSDGQLFKWPNGEHAVIIVGYDEKYIYINDPYSGKEKKYKRDIINNRYVSLGKQALSILPAEKIMRLKINGEVLASDLSGEILKKEEKIWIPIRYLPLIISDIRYEYKDKVTYLYYKDTSIEIALQENKNQAMNTLIEGKEIGLYYQIEKGVTRIDLSWLIEAFPISCEVTDDTVAIWYKEERMPEENLIKPLQITEEAELIKE